MRQKIAVVGLVTAVLAASGGLVLGGAASASAATSFSTPCFTSPNMSVAGTYTVPATGVSEVRAVLRGQDGAAGTNFGTGINITGRPQDPKTGGGKGSTMVVELTVTPGQVLTVGSLTGGAAGNAELGLLRLDGRGVYMAAGGGKGGDAQFVTTTGADGCQHALAVAAGGGGGSGKLAAGGNADAGSGATAGQDGGSNMAVDGGGGGAGSASMGGNPGAKGHDPGFCHDGENGSWGSFLAGGQGGNASARVLTITSCLFPAHSAGGGGAGYYFGGGGASAYASGNDTDGAVYSPGAGGGGSSFVDPSVRNISQTAVATTGPPIAAPVYNTSTTVTSTPNPSYAGGSVTVTSRTTVAGTATPAALGNVQILRGSTVLATVPVGSNGEASWTTTSLPAGDIGLTASYLSSESPSVAYRASRSDGALTQVVHDCAPTPSFIDQPVNISGTKDSAVYLGATVSVSPLFEGVPTMRWQTSADGATNWTDASGTSAVQTTDVAAGTGRATMSYNITGALGVRWYRAIASTCGGSVTSAKASLTVRGIAFDLTTLPAKTFGSPAFDVASYAAASTVTVGFASATPDACSVVGSVVTVLSAGTCTITASESGTSGYPTAPEVSSSFSTAKKVLTVVAAASPASQPYGTATAPTVSCTSNGFLGGDTFVTPPTGRTGGYVYDSDGVSIFRQITIRSTTSQGSYVTHCSGGDPGTDYSIGKYTDGTFKITAPPPPPLKITANDESSTYGATPPALTAAYSVEVPASSLTGTLACWAYASSDTGYESPLTLSETTPAGAYTVHCGGLTSSTHTLSWADGRLTVRPAPVTVTASSPATQAFGATSAPTVTCSSTGFIGTDGFVTAPTGAVLDSSGEPVVIGSDTGLGAYTTACAGGDPGSNYTVDAYVTGTFSIEDRTAPVVTVPDDRTIEATGPTGAATSFGASAVDAVDGSTSVVCDPVSGSTFALGTQTVTCSSSDAVGNAGSASFSVTVKDTLAPDTGLTSSAPASPTKQTTAGFTFSGTDLVGVTGYDCSLDGAVFASCLSPKSFSSLAEGGHTFQVRARDAAGNVDQTPATRTWVIDTIAPVVTVSDLTVDATSPAGATVPFTATAADINPSRPAVTCTRTSGSTFAIGSTTVTCSATDAAGNTGSAKFTVVVKGGGTQLTELQNEVNKLTAVDSSTLKNLTSILANAQKAVAKKDLPSACDKLASFVSQVRAQSGKTIPASTADVLITDARRIMAVLGC
jgi:hypothetical protein